MLVRMEVAATGTVMHTNNLICTGSSIELSSLVRLFEDSDEKRAPRRH